MPSLPTHQDELEYLERLGFPTNPFNQRAANLKEVWEISEQLDTKKEDLAYPIDGLVVKLNNNATVEELGVVGKTPRGWCAIKFKAEEVTTKIVGVTWQVGRTGKVTPVADLEPVELGGTTVKRATLHNYKEFVEKALQPKDTLVIRKAGEIIPEVVTVLYNLRTNSIADSDNSEPLIDKQTYTTQAFIAPATCPSCGTHLETSATGVDLFCPNDETCKDQIIGRLAYYCQRNVADITGLSEKSLEKFIELFGIRDIPDLYNLPYEEILGLEGFGPKSVENLVNSVNEAREIPDYKFLAGLGLEGVGPEVAKLICQALGEEE